MNGPKKKLKSRKRDLTELTAPPVRQASTEQGAVVSDKPPSTAWQDAFAQVDNIDMNMDMTTFAMQLWGFDDAQSLYDRYGQRLMATSLTGPGVGAGAGTGSSGASGAYRSSPRRFVWPQPRFMVRDRLLVVETEPEQWFMLEPPPRSPTIERAYLLFGQSATASTGLFQYYGACITESGRRLALQVRASSVLHSGTLLDGWLQYLPPRASHTHHDNDVDDDDGGGGSEENDQKMEDEHGASREEQRAEPRLVFHILDAPALCGENWYITKEFGETRKDIEACLQKHMVSVHALHAVSPTDQASDEQGTGSSSGWTPIPLTLQFVPAWNVASQFRAAWPAGAAAIPPRLWFIAANRVLDIPRRMDRFFEWEAQPLLAIGLYRDRCYIRQGRGGYAPAGCPTSWRVSLGFPLFLEPASSSIQPDVKGTDEHTECKSQEPPQTLDIDVDIPCVVMVEPRIEKVTPALRKALGLKAAELIDTKNVVLCRPVFRCRHARAQPYTSAEIQHVMLMKEDNITRATLWHAFGAAVRRG